MEGFFNILALALPAAALGLLSWYTVKKKRAGALSGKLMTRNLAFFALIVVLSSVMAFGVSAETGEPETPETEVTVQSSDNGKGLGLLAAGLVTGLAGIGGGIAVAAGAPAAIAATSEDPKVFGKALIFVALGESIALYGVVISILILNKI